MDKFTNWQHINKLSTNRDVILFGAGNIANKTLRKLDCKPLCIVDNNPNLYDTEQLSLTLKSPAYFDTSGVLAISPVFLNF